jgi:hypothetical protein
MFVFIFFVAVIAAALDGDRDLKGGEDSSEPAGLYTILTTVSAARSHYM